MVKYESSPNREGAAAARTRECQRSVFAQARAILVTEAIRLIRDGDDGTLADTLDAIEGLTPLVTGKV